MIHEPRIDIRYAQPSDVERILELVRELADYERALDCVEATAEDLRRAFFGPSPSAEVIVAANDDCVVGMAVFFHNFSTWTGRSGIYLEDLYVTPNVRGRGIGEKLLATLAGIAVERGCPRFEWSVLEWNQPAIDFYVSKGARPMGEWRTYRVDGDRLQDLASSKGSHVLKPITNSA